MNPEVQREIQGQDKDEYVEGGYGWVIAGAGFLIYAIVPGVMMSLGVLIEHYAVLLGDTTSLAMLTMVGTVANSLFSLLGMWSGVVVDRYGHGTTIMYATVLFSGGLFLASYATRDWHLLLSLGIVSGIGDSLVTIAVISAPAQYFNRRLGLVTGLVMAGYGVGALVFSPTIELLLSEYSVKRTLQGLAAGSFVCLTSLSLVYTNKSTTTIRSVNWAMFRNLQFQMLFLATTFWAMGYLIPFIILPTYTASLGFPSQDNGLLLGILNGATALGRIVLGPVADRVGRIEIMAMTSVTASLSCLIWIYATTFTHVAIFCVIFGTTAGSFLSLLSVVARQLFPDESVAGITGLAYFATGLPYLIGTPIATALSQYFSHSDPPTTYVPASIFSGVFILLVLFPLLRLQWLVRQSQTHIILSID
ncbi:hypothetical protein DSO57_1013451 [Entomophthora muscae]|uniref:Uncharacterized protein n=1 Tax=Entomophthora muscae TaxID=34485 RepID=A0ACC2SIK1_9FUNG|nr:hypothetical protein DSO57_1013451 [Entomophthora muscae]